MYFYTEMWTRWIKIFKDMRELRRKQGKNLWINFTCYVTPSPWWLQYVNSIWLQNSSDIGFAQNYPEGEQAQVDSEITYRDGIYYDFAVKRGLQFPFQTFITMNRFTVVKPTLITRMRNLKRLFLERMPRRSS